jgi:hypothetical protein
MRYRRPHSVFAFLSLGLLVGVTAAVSTALGPSPSARPAATKPLSATVPADAMQFFKDKNFSGTMFQVSDVTTKLSWRAHQFEGKQENKISSLRWNLPPGVVVNLHERDDGLGRTIYIFGSGEISEIKPWKLNDKLSSWAWNYIGGASNPPKRIADALAPKPKYAKECDPIDSDSVQLFKNRECKGTMTAMEHITSQPAGVFKELPAKGVSSVKWKLPEGTMVVFSEGPGGESQQVAIWGQGMFESFHQWDMNDKVKHWAWYYVGEEASAEQ